MKYVFFCAQKSTTKAGNNMFQDLINAPRIWLKFHCLLTVCLEPDVVIIHDVVRIFAEEETIRDVALAAKIYGVNLSTVIIMSP